MSILAPISAGELIDKITILRVKAQRIGDPAKEANVRKELALLEATDAERHCERRQDFGPDFVALARRVYIDNDRRAALKRAINEAAGSDIVEEKSYKPYLKS